MGQWVGAQGRPKVAKFPNHSLILTSPPETPHQKQKTFFSMSTRRLAESVDGLNSSLSLAAGDLWPQKSRSIAAIKGWPFNAHAGHLSGRDFFGHNSPAAAAREVFKPSKDAASLLGSIKKFFFYFGEGFAWEELAKLGCFCIFTNFD